MEEHPFCEGGGFVWCKPDAHQFFQSTSIPPNIRYSIHTFLQIIPVLNGYSEDLWLPFGVMPILCTLKTGKKKWFVF